MAPYPSGGTACVLGLARAHATTGHRGGAPGHASLPAVSSGDRFHAPVMETRRSPCDPSMSTRSSGPDPLACVRQAASARPCPCEAADARPDPHAKSLRCGNGLWGWSGSRERGCGPSRVAGGGQSRGPLLERVGFTIWVLAWPRPCLQPRLPETPGPSPFVAATAPWGGASRVCTRGLGPTKPWWDRADVAFRRFVFLPCQAVAAWPRPSFPLLVGRVPSAGGSLNGVLGFCCSHAMGA